MRATTRTAVACLALAACAGGTDDETVDTDTDTDVDPPCVFFDATDPNLRVEIHVPTENGQVGTGSPIVIKPGSWPLENLELTLSSGGSTAVDLDAPVALGAYAMVRPSSPLEADTAYHLSIAGFDRDVQCATWERSFRVADVGDASPDPGTSTYVAATVDVSRLANDGYPVLPFALTSPPGDDNLLIDLRAQGGLVLSFTPSKGGLAAVAGTLATQVVEGVQDVCVETPWLSGAWDDATQGTFTLATDPGETADLWGLEGLEITSVSGRFDTAAERIVDLSVEAAWDVGDLTFFTFDDPATPGCTYYGTVVPTACGPCPAGGDDTCVPVTLEAMVADVDGALALSYVGPDDIAGDPDCGALP
ncbi:MAG: hypothetical protein H6733_17650 [Alphaproteobacteria bacterium]|nr:hypothetical protein [Alphaproteobacteria bacterium]